MAATWGRKNPKEVGTAAFYNEVLRTVSRLIGLDRMSALRIDVHKPLHLAGYFALLYSDSFIVR